MCKGPRLGECSLISMLSHEMSQSIPDWVGNEAARWDWGEKKKRKEAQKRNKVRRRKNERRGHTDRDEGGVAQLLRAPAFIACSGLTAAQSSSSASPLWPGTSCAPETAGVSIATWACDRQGEQILPGLQHRRVRKTAQLQEEGDGTASLKTLFLKCKAIWELLCSPAGQFLGHTCLEAKDVGSEVISLAGVA